MNNNQGLLERPDLITRSAIFTGLVFAPILLWTLGLQTPAELLAVLNWSVGLTLTIRGFSWDSVKLGLVLLMPAVGFGAGYIVGSVLNIAALYQWVFILAGGAWAGGYYSSRLLARYKRGIVRLGLALYAPILFFIPGYIAMLYVALGDPDL